MCIMYNYIYNNNNITVCIYNLILRYVNLAIPLSKIQ